MKVFVILTLFTLIGCGRVADNTKAEPGKFKQVPQDEAPNGIEDQPTSQVELDRSLRVAVRASETAMARIALRNGANPDIEIDGIKIISYVVKTKQYSLLRLLLQFKVDVNLQSRDGNFPIHHAILNESIRCLRILLDHKETSVNIFNKQGKTALELAMELSLIDYALLILKHSPDINDIPDGLLQKSNQATRLINIIRELQSADNDLILVKIIEEADYITFDYVVAYFIQNELCLSDEFLLLAIKAAGQEKMYPLLNQIKELKTFNDYEVFNLFRWAIEKLSYEQLKELVTKFETLPIDYVDSESKTLLSYAVETLKLNKVILIRSLGSSTEFTYQNNSKTNCDYLPRKRFNRQRITISRIQAALGC